MTRPSYLRSSLRAQPQLPICLRAKIISGARLCGLRTLGYLAFMGILVGASSLTAALPQPKDQIGIRSSAGLPAYPLIPVGYSSVSYPLQLQQLLAINSNELPTADQIRNLAFSPPQQFASVRLTSMVQGACGRRCFDPHPGPFRFWYGQQSGCWVQVWRSWPDGCQHYQWYNSCDGYWDLHPNGAPRVNWTCCVH